LLNNIPFSVYDFFAYLSAGVVVLAAGLYIDPGFVLPPAWQGTMSLALGVVAAYTAGHIIALISGFLLERRLTIRILGRAEDFLLQKTAQKDWRNRLFPGYTDGLPDSTIDDVLARVPDAVKQGSTRRAVFLHCWRVVRLSPAVAARLDTFLAQYGFCRNMAVALGLAAIVFAGDAIADHIRRIPIPPELWIWLIVAVVAAPFMYYGYLKFYRQYTYEVFTNF